MALQDAMQGSVLRTIKCDNPGCTREITFDRKNEKETFELNVWLKSIRLIQTIDNRNFVYCSDKCEVEATATGIHNLPVQKQIIPAGNPADIAAAAAAAQAASVSDQNLKSGAGGPVIIP